MQHETQHTDSLPLLPIDGLRLGTASAGLRHAHGAKAAESPQGDLTLIALDEGTQTAAVFTRNAFCAAPVLVARRHLSQCPPRYLIINAGNANAGTGERGLADARVCCEAVARQVHGEPEAVLPFSTGVIGEYLPVERIRAAIPQAHGRLAADGWASAARAIMTTDTVPKTASQRITARPSTSRSERFSVTGMAKGAGMIRPDMATLLAFVATDAKVSAPVLQHCLAYAVEESFHRITVDGDTSTNDACVLMATGASGSETIQSVEDPHFEALRSGITAVCQSLAQGIVRDAEGATKLVTIDIRGGSNQAECRKAAFTIAHSPLVKTTLFASDPNWGRILAAVGRAGLSDLRIDKVRIFLDEVCVAASGARHEAYREEDGQRVMAKPAFTLRVDLGRGEASTKIWTCDLSFEYVRINAEYRT